MPWRWVRWEHDPGRYYLYAGNVMLGAWIIEEQAYRPYEARSNTLGSPVEPPAQPPQRGRGSAGAGGQESEVRGQRSEVSDEVKKRPPEIEVTRDGGVAPGLEKDRNFGVDVSHIDGQPGYWLKDRPLNKSQAHDIAKNGLPEDAGKLRFTVIGTTEERARVLKDVGASAAIMGRVLVWAVPPGHHSLKDTVTGKSMFVEDGKPTVYLQAPDGRVLYREQSWQAGDVEAIRRAVEGYDAKKDPGRRGAFQLEDVPVWVWVAAGLGLVLVMRRSEPRG